MLATKSIARCVCVFLGLVPLATAASPVITSSAPISLQPGATVEQVFIGSGFTNAARLWTSFPAVTERLADTNGKSLRFRIGIPETTPVGLGTLRIVDAHGVTPLQLVVLDDLPSIPRDAKNTSPETAQLVTLPTAITGTVGKTQQQYFRFSAEAGQRIAVDVLARRIGSAMDPMIRILEPSGQEVAFSDDEPGLIGDARLSHIFSKPGEYLLELRDIRYAGGSTYWYHMRLGDFPQVTVPYPLAVPRGQATAVWFESLDGTNIEPQTITPPNDRDWLTLGVRGADGPSTLVTLQVSNDPEYQESEPNNTREQANAVDLGDQINGRFETPGDVDHFQFSAQKGQKFQFEAVTHKVGSPVDLVLSLWNSKGKKLASVDDVGTSDAILKHTFAADGEYVLHAVDLNQRGGPGYVYRITVKQNPPAFAVSADSDHLNVPAGGTAVLNITRTGDKKPVTISAENVPEGWSVRPTVLGSGQMQAAMTITHTGDSASTSFVPSLSLRASQLDTPNSNHAVSVLSAVQKRYASWTTLPESLPTSFSLATAEAPLFQLTATPDVIEVAQKSQTKVEITATWADGTTEPITLSLQPVTVNKKSVPFLPANVTTKIVSIPKDGSAGTITFSATDKAVPGEYTVVVRGTLKRGKQTFVVPAASIPLHVKPAQPDPAK